jgi:rod shape determining protein RodA
MLGRAKRFDYVLMILLLVLALVGLVVLYSATRVMPKDNGDRMFTVQVVCTIIGFILAFIIAIMDYGMFKVIGPIIYSLGVLMLIFVLFAPTINGSHSWINLGGLGTFQPSELAKVATIIIIAYFLEKFEEEQGSRKINFLKLAIFSAIPIFLVFMQPDYGTCLVFAGIAVVMYFFAGIEYKQIAIIIGVCAVIGILLWVFLIPNVPYILDRILVFVDPGRDPGGAGMNVFMSKVAIGSGEWFGKGFLMGSYTQGATVPVKESDFIFSVIGEEWGFVGSIIVLFLFTAIILRCIMISRHARDKFGSYIAIGVAAMMTIHVFENIGMSIGMLPVTGIPLPFVSAGGTALIVYYIAMGVVLSISGQRDGGLIPDKLI